ncbi:nucleotidyltransferase family protein [Sporichthya polymorpha]|uniref:nucleotidyltransferase family protein n=1 Tax=Sporichthya polymorpha TaxID=35751 RepID=UPI00035F3BA1|nr:nucleotidyltransferase family protein [Sporichthya polymorpha]
MAVAGLVLAAGSGSRLGAPKALVELGGERLVDRAVRVLRDGGCDPLVVVSGAAPFTVAGATVVPNPDWATGMGSSLRVGLGALAATDAAAVVVSLVDQPDIGADVVRRVIDAFAAGASVATATYEGKRRNPVLFARPTWDEVARLAEGDAGARPFLAAHPELITPVACDDLGSPADIDTPADLARARGEADGAPGR